MADSIRVALIGSGGRAPAHVQAWSGVPGATVVACTGLHPQRREALAQTYGLKAYADPRKMIREQRPDVVQIVTGPESRVELMTLVSELGVKACTVEKPVAIGRDDWKALKRLSRSTATLFAVCHQFRWQEQLIRCRRELESGALGRVRLIEMSSGMNLPGQGTHTLDYGMSLIGDSPVVRVFGTVGSASGADPMHLAPEDSLAWLEFANGTQGLWTCGRTAPRCGDPATTWQHVRVAAWAERGRVTWQEFGNCEIESATTSVEVPFPGLAAWEKGNLAAQTAFHQAVVDWMRGGPSPGTCLDQALHQWKVALAVSESSHLRRPLDLEHFEVNGHEWSQQI